MPKFLTTTVPFFNGFKEQLTGISQYNPPSLGWYVCIAANSEGIATSRAYLRVKDLCKGIKCGRKQTCVVSFKQQTCFKVNFQLQDLVNFMSE